jgi:hypothetical protein
MQPVRVISTCDKLNVLVDRNHHAEHARFCCTFRLHAVLTSTRGVPNKARVCASLSVASLLNQRNKRPPRVSHARSDHKIMLTILTHAHSTATFSRRAPRPSSDVHIPWHLHEQPIHIFLYLPDNRRIDSDTNWVVLALLAPEARMHWISSNLTLTFHMTHCMNSESHLFHDRVRDRAASAQCTNRPSKSLDQYTWSPANEHGGCYRFRGEVDAF